MSTDMFQNASTQTLDEFFTQNPAEEVDRIVQALEGFVHQTLRRQGVVVAISGGIDSSVVLALCVRAFGAQQVLGLLLPEKDSSPESLVLALELAEKFGVQTVVEDITSVLEGYGCYQRRNEAVKRIFPEFKPDWGIKIVLPDDLLERGTLNIFHLVITDLQGNQYSKRLPPREYAQIVAASNFKQRTRTNMLYYYAELRNYAVIGTPNKNEHDLGFFVKFGDGGYDFAPIRHLLKTQVFQLGEYLEIPTSIQSRQPTTDTYPGSGSQQEFFFRIPFHILDAIWWGCEKGLSAADIAGQLNLTGEQVQRVIQDIERKKRTTEHLRLPGNGL
jgi:NAD+ synthase